MLFFDASALVKRYVAEPETARVTRMLTRGHAAVCRLTEVEISSALSRRRHDGLLGPGEHESALGWLQADLARLEVVEIDRHVVNRTHGLLARHRLRAADALQLAACLVLRDAVDPEIVLVSYDTRLNVAARAEGLTVEP